MSTPDPREWFTEADHNAFARHLTFVLFVGAAVADASPEQRQSLAEVPDMIRDPNVSLRPACERVIEIMGPAWVPTGEWATYINNVIGGPA